MDFFFTWGNYSSMFRRLSFHLNTLPNDLNFGCGYLPTHSVYLGQLYYGTVFEEKSNLHPETVISGRKEKGGIPVHRE